MDVTNQHIAFTLQLKLAEAFDQFMKQLVSGKEFHMQGRPENRGDPKTGRVRISNCRHGLSKFGPFRNWTFIV